jgi:hypothetical protein
MNNKKASPVVCIRRLAAGGGVLLLIAFGSASPAWAAVAYDTGALNFATTNQSMWGPGSGFQDSQSVFVGTQWSNKTANLGGFIGGQTQPVTGPTNLGWYTWETCVNTINFLCGSEPDPKIGVIIPGTDTRTGATVDLTTSGKFGLNFGYTINSGTVAANVGFGAGASLPQTDVAKQQYFSLNTTSSLNSGQVSSQSPEISASLSAVAQFSGSVSAKGCLVGQCASGTANLPTMNVNQQLLSLDPNGLSVLPGVLPPENPGGPTRPLATVPLGSQGLGLEGAAAATGEVGFKLTGPPNGSTTLVDTVPQGIPALTEPLASVDFNVPNIATSGQLGNGSIASSGTDSLLTANVDLTGMGAIFAGFPTQIGVDLFKSSAVQVSMGLTGLDVQAGPQLSVGQNFNLTPTLMVNLAFSSPVMIAGESGLQSSWQGAWADLPQIALLQNTTFMPTFWVDGQINNVTSLDLGLQGIYNLLQLTANVSIGGYDAIDLTSVSLNQLLGLGDTLFSTPTINFPVFNNTYDLSGFNSIDGTPFTIDVAGTVSEPGTLGLFAASVGLMLFGGPILRRRQRRRRRA